jgi:hypothetical protein
MSSPIRVLREVITAGIEAGEVPAADPNVATAMVMGLVLQVAVSKVYGGVNQSLSSLADTLVASWRILAG